MLLWVIAQALILFVEAPVYGVTKGNFMAVNWETLEQFTVESATGNNNLYANGRQSIKVRLGIKVLDRNSQPVALTEKERLSITLVNFHGGAALPYRDPWANDSLDPANGKWDWSIQNIGDYNHFPSSGPRAQSPSAELPRASSGETAYIDLYVRTVDLNPLTLSARITREDGEQFYSREMGEGALLLAPVRVPTYRASDYTMEKFVIVPARPIKGGVGSLDYYKFGLAASGSPLGFRDVTCSPGGLHGDIGPGWTTAAADMVGYVKPGHKVINYLFPLKYVDPTMTWEPRSEQIVFAKTYVQARDGYYFEELRGRTAVLRTNIRATDEYGNVHLLTLRFKDNKRSGDLEFV